ncbi:MAG: hypothetical protein JO302_04790 [Candidatus Eremiobacteraeota bacterium]|nr:hypothetical protein [Candidatus Eremiobacteraeota bacterium]
MSPSTSSSPITGHRALDLPTYPSGRTTRSVVQPGEEQAGWTRTRDEYRYSFYAVCEIAHR